MTPAIHIGPDPPEHLVRAVEAGGGRPVALEEAEGVVWAGSEPELPELPPSVRWVQLQSAGVEPWVERVRDTPDVLFTSAVGAYSTQVAEIALALLLAGVRGFAHYARTQTWDPRPAGVLEGSTVAILGAGGIGRELIALLAPHDVEIVAVTRSGRDGTLPAERLGEVWGAADHFVIAAPATDGTRHLVGADELAAMRPHSWVVNVARGSLIDTDALVAALRDEAIGGAGLDVTDPEPLPDGHPLWSSPRALITPHVANPPSTMDRDLAKRVRENVRRFAAGEELLAPVSADRGVLMLKEFREFILRGNVVDLAVAVVIGTAFTAVVTSTVEDLLTPLITAIAGEPDFGGLRFTINDSEFRYGEWLNAVVSFASIATVVFFFVVKPINLFYARRSAEAPDPPAPAEDVRLLTEIRDLLAQSPASDTPSRPT